MEDLILGACLKSREAYEIVKQSEIKWTALVEQVWNHVDTVYQRDANLEQVPKEVLLALIDRKAQNPKHAQLYKDVALKCYGLEVSIPNILELIKEDRTHKLAVELLSSTQKRDAKKVEKILAELERLGKATAEDTLIDVTPASSLIDLVQRRLDVNSLIKVGPRPLNEMLGGGVMKGHHIVFFARPESGKTAFGVTNAAFLIRQGLRGIYLMNEDRRDDIELRVLTCLTQKSASELRQEGVWEDAQAILDRYRYQDRILYADCNPGSLRDIRKMLETHRPDWLVVDQLRNLDPGKSESNTNRLDMVARGVRDLLKEYDVLGISLTQAGDSASNKLELDMSDVDSSKTGIPAACDVMVGMGVNESFEMLGQRMLSVCKNKMPEGKGHGHFPVKIDRLTSKIMEIG